MKNNSAHLTHPKYRADIDGLRAIAVLSVVGFHAFPNWVKGGFIGVDIFFVISGYLISTILFENLERDTFSFTEFFARRIKRIFPALLLVLVSCLVLGWFALLPGEYKQLGKHIAGGAGFISNFLFLNEAGYFDNAAETKPLLHLWSLGIEEQFYIVWPFLLWLAWKKRFNLLTITVVVAFISYYLNVEGVRSDPIATFYSPQTRFWELLCGSLLAWFDLYKKDRFVNVRNKLDACLVGIIYRQAPETNGKALSNLLSLSGILFIAYGVYTITKKSPFPGAWALLPTLGAVLIISAGAQAWINRVILSNRVLVWFGIISFPLYLWHWPLLSFAQIIEGERPSWKILITALVISVVFAWLTYRLIEKPIRFGKNGKYKTILLVVLMFIVGYGGYNVYGRDGLEFRFKKQKAVLEIIAHPRHPVKSFDCSKWIPEFRNIEFNKGGCVLSKDSAPTVMFVGDSHMGQYRESVWNNFSSESVLMIVEHGCLPFSSNHFMRGDCKEKYNAIINFLDSNTSIKTIYLSGYWSYLMTGGSSKEGTRWRNSLPVYSEVVKAFKEHGIHFISKVIKKQKEIVFLKDIPDLDFDIESCFDVRPLRLSSRKNIGEECSLDFSNYRERVKDYDKVINEILVSFPQVRVYDPLPLFCRNGKCFASNGSLPYYENGDHLNHYGAEMVIKDMLSNKNILQ